MARIVIVLSGSDHWTLEDGIRHPTGYWAEEFAVPHRTFRDRGVEAQIATPGGVRPTVDPVSLTPERNGGDARRAEELARYIADLPDLAHPARLGNVGERAGEFDAVFIPGGHAPMEDLPGSAPLGRLLTELYDSGRVVAAVCHGPAGLLSGNREDGSWLFAGKRLTGFTNEEERQGGLAEKAPWLLEDRLRERGGQFEAGPPWQPHVVVDGLLVTGQNPASSHDTAEATLTALHVPA